jgi:UDP-3-O-[3-hydroxymyristoyl] glucosamine N-acyltransferase
MLGDNVSVGSNSVINRGALADTVIGSGTKIDSLVIVAHNVEIGPNCVLVSQVGISGSVKIGKHVTLGGQVGVAGHLEIGDNVTVAAQGGVSHDLGPNKVYLGAPARPLSQGRKALATFQKLPELRQEIKHVRKRMAEITAMLGKDLSAMVEPDE